MRVSAASSRLFCLPGIWVRQVARLPDRVVATVALRRLMVSPLCDDTTRSREDPRHVESPWRQLDLGIWQLQVRARLRRLCGAVHGVAFGCDCFSIVLVLMSTVLVQSGQCPGHPAAGPAVADLDGGTGRMDDPR